MNQHLEKVFNEHTMNDKSFLEKPSPLEILFGGKKFTQMDMRETWLSGIKYGIELGFIEASVEGQRIQLHDSSISEKNREFLERFYKLADEYDCCIQYLPTCGMMVLDKASRPIQLAKLDGIESCFN